MRLNTSALVILVVGLVFSSSSAGARLHEPVVADAPAKQCRSGFVHAVIAGKHECLKAGQPCAKRLDRHYHRYRFHCHRGRLTGGPTKGTGSLPTDVTAAIDVGGEAWNVVAGAGAVWVQVGDVGAVRIEPQTNRVTARIGEVGNLAFAGADLWGAAGNRLLLLDPATGRSLRSIRLPADEAYRVAPGDGMLWASSGNRVFGVDPGGLRVTEFSVACPGAREMTFGHGSLWLACKDAGTVLRIDTQTGDVEATISSGAAPHHVAIGEGAVWVTNIDENSVSRIDPATNSVSTKIRGVGAGAGLTIGAGFVWASRTNGIAKIDPRTNAIVRRVQLPYSQHYYGLCIAEGSLWASARTLRRVYRVKL